LSRVAGLKWAGRMMQHGRIELGATAASRVARLVGLAAVLAATAGLAGCASISEKIAGTASEMPAIGLPAGAPQRPAEQLTFPAVHDMPPPRDAAVLNEAEQKKLETDLVAARDAQRGSSGAPAPAQKKPARQAPRVVPVASSRTIY
jgi:hypothetical protein